VEAFLHDLKIDSPRRGCRTDPKAIWRQRVPTTVLIGIDGKVQFYEAGALANAQVAFDNLLQQNRQLSAIRPGHLSEDYRLQAQKQPSLPVRQTVQKSSDEKNSNSTSAESASLPHGLPAAAIRKSSPAPAAL